MWQLTYLAAAALLILGQTLLDNTQNVWIDVYTLPTLTHGAVATSPIADDLL